MRLVRALLLSVACLSAGEFPIGSRLPTIDFSGPGAPAAIQTSTAKATVVVFVSTQCPVSNAYNERLAAIYNDYASKGVQLVFVNGNATETLNDVEEHERRVGWPFKVVKDAGDALADRLNAQHTPESFVFDRNGTLMYHGRVDDSQNPANVKRQDLRSAINAVLSGRPVPVAETRAFGCGIKRAGK